MDNKDTRKVPAETNLTKNEIVPVMAPATVTALSPEIAAAIAAAVGAAMQPVMDMLTRNAAAVAAPAPTTEAPRLTSPQPNKQLPHRMGKLQGIPVQEGQDIRHVPREVINEWFSNLEDRWKQKHNAFKKLGTPVNMSLSRGTN